MNMRLLNHVYGFGARRKLLRAGVFGRVASRSFFWTLVGTTKCLSLCVMKWTFIQCEQFVELTPFIDQGHSKLVILHARSKAFVLLNCEDASQYSPILILSLQQMETCILC